MLKKLIGKSVVSLAVASALMLLAGNVGSAASLCQVTGSQSGKYGYATVINTANNARYCAVAVYGTNLNQTKNGTQLKGECGTIKSKGSKAVHADISSYSHAYAGGSIYNSAAYESHIAESHVVMIK